MRRITLRGSAICVLTAGWAQSGRNTKGIESDSSTNIANTADSGAEAWRTGVKAAYRMTKTLNERYTSDREKGTRAAATVGSANTPGTLLRR